MEPVGEFTPCFLRVVARFSAHADPNTLNGCDKLKTVCPRTELLSVPVIYFHITTWFGGELAINTISKQGVLFYLGIKNLSGTELSVRTQRKFFSPDFFCIFLMCEIFSSLFLTMMPLNLNNNCIGCVAVECVCRDHSDCYLLSLTAKQPFKQAN
jgi:hypothetical protein